MEEERSILEKILDGEASLGDYDLDSDFDHEEICKLLEAGIIEPRDLSDGRASDMILDGSLSYDEYPFENFTHYEQVRQLEQEVISREDFKAKAELEYYDGDDWLLLLDVWPELDAEAPWDMIRDEARAESWFDFLASHPEYADRQTGNVFLKLAKQRNTSICWRNSPPCLNPVRTSRNFLRRIPRFGWSCSSSSPVSRKSIR